VKMYMTRGLFSKSCSAIARKCAYKRVSEEALEAFISQFDWFSQMRGIKKRGRGYIKGSAGFLFGGDWCREEIKKALIETGVYEADKKTKNLYSVRLVDET